MKFPRPAQVLGFPQSYYIDIKKYVRLKETLTSRLA